MPKKMLGTNVFDEALMRMIKVYEEGHRVVVSFSGGKDSGICLELCILAAQATGNLPVDVVMRDEEIMLPGTFEYSERMYHRPEVNFKWAYACQPICNVFNRENPYWWVFDPDLPPEAWVRQPPPFAERIPELNIAGLVNPKTHPPAEGKDLCIVIGLRVDESRNRYMGLFSSKGYLTRRSNDGVRHCRPIYDWRDGDVWKAIKDNGWDYNRSYDTMVRLGIPRNRLRIAPPTMNMYGIEQLQKAAQAWPEWFDRVAERCPGARSAVHYGKRSCQPLRRHGETWEACFKRTCIENAPDWIAERSTKIMETTLARHRTHAASPFPEVKPCYMCTEMVGSWSRMAAVMYSGDPFSVKVKLPYMEPEFFKKGSGTWGGTPQWA